MKKFLLSIALCAVSFCLSAKDVKISASPSDAKIYIDGNYVGDGMTMASFKKNDEFIVIKVEKTGYITIETKFYYSDQRKAVSYTLKRDEMMDNSVVSANANNDFTQTVSKEYDRETAWKLIHQVILNYFDEIKTSDQTSGYVQTAWVYQSFPEVQKQVRTRITVKESGTGSESLTYKIKVTSEIAPLNASREDSFQPWDRILKKYETLISEFQSRLGKN